MQTKIMQKKVKPKLGKIREGSKKKTSSTSYFLLQIFMSSFQKNYGKFKWRRLEFFKWYI
ncbi:hypothetical protein ACIQXV_15380 [Neobacillus sp. NPDC097160]|uniref:hypothetical protein n=1 Tax=Neobacillus sp. NPDC097160 TaxID=3364298 RepID=UPI00380E8A1D